MLLKPVVVSVVTLTHGRVPGLRFANFVCSSCRHCLFDVTRCILHGASAMPDHIIAPAIPEELALRVVFSAAGVWPGTPTCPQVVFRYDFFDAMRFMQHQ